jgi:hypothetical protein
MLKFEKMNLSREVEGTGPVKPGNLRRFMQGANSSKMQTILRDKVK